MKREDLLDAIGEVDDAFITEAQQPGKRHRGWRMGMGLSAFLALGLLVLSLPRILNLGAEAPWEPPADYEVPLEELSYVHYHGPVLPLTLGEECSGIRAARMVSFDFSCYSDGDFGRKDEDGVVVTDAYSLTNETDRTMTVTAIYPFVSSVRFSGSFPTIFLNGVDTEYALHAGSHTGTYVGEGSDTRSIRSYLGYEELISDGTYYDSIVADEQSPSIPVTVYRFSGFVNESVPYVEKPFVEIKLQVDAQQTKVFMTENRWSSGIDQDGNRYFRSYLGKDLGDEENAFSIILVGEDPEGYALSAYADNDTRTGGDTPVEGVHCCVERYETTLDQVLRQINGSDPYVDNITTFLIPEEDLELTVRLAVELLLEDGSLGIAGTERYSYLPDALYDAYRHERIFCAVFPVTIAPGETVLCEAQMLRRGHSDNSGFLAYDMATTLGSNLSFTSQGVKTRGWSWVRIDDPILNQNLELDPYKGVTEVCLDLSKPCYWMELTRKKEILEENPQVRNGFAAGVGDLSLR